MLRNNLNMKIAKYREERKSKKMSNLVVVKRSNKIFEAQSSKLKSKKYL